MMIAKKLQWLDREAEEAEVLASDSVWKCKAYCMPCQISEGEEVKWLFCAFCSDIVSAVTEGFRLTPLAKKEYGYEITGRIVDPKEGLVAVGGLVFLVDQSIPGDLKESDWVQFTVDRVSC